MAKYQKGRTERKWKEKHEENWANKLLPPMLAYDVKNCIPPEQMPDVDFSQGEGLYIYGKLQTGKTVLAGKVMLEEKKRQWLNHEQGDFQFCETTELFLELKRSFSDPEITEYDVTKKYQHMDFLVLDDFGVFGKPSEWLLMTLYSIINWRMQHQKPTVYTSNYSLDQISNLLGDQRISSRIRRSCKLIRKTDWQKTSKECVKP